MQFRDIVTLDDIVSQEQTRTVIGSVVFGSVLPVAVIRAQDVSPGHLIELVALALRQHEEMLQQGALISIDEARLRRDGLSVLSIVRPSLFAVLIAGSGVQA